MSARGGPVVALAGLVLIAVLALLHYGTLACVVAGAYIVTAVVLVWRGRHDSLPPGDGATKYPGPLVP